MLIEQNRTLPPKSCIFYQGESSQTREVEQLGQRPGWAGIWQPPTAFALLEAPPDRDRSFQGPYREGRDARKKAKNNTASI